MDFADYLSKTRKIHIKTADFARYLLKTRKIYLCQERDRVLVGWVEIFTKAEM